MRFSLKDVKDRSYFRAKMISILGKMWGETWDKNTSKPDIYNKESLLPYGSNGSLRYDIIENKNHKSNDSFILLIYGNLKNSIFDIEQIKDWIIKVATTLLKYKGGCILLSCEFSVDQVAGSRMIIYPVYNGEKQEMDFKFLVNNSIL